MKHNIKNIICIFLLIGFAHGKEPKLFDYEKGKEYNQKKYITLINDFSFKIQEAEMMRWQLLGGSAIAFGWGVYTLNTKEPMELPFYIGGGLAVLGELVPSIMIYNAMIRFRRLKELEIKVAF